MYSELSVVVFLSKLAFFQPFAGDHGHDHSHNHDGHNHEKPSELTSLIVSEGHCDHHEHRDAENDHNRNINLHAAYLHVLGDLAQSVAVCLGGMTCVLPRCKE